MKLQVLNLFGIIIISLSIFSYFKEDTNPATYWGGTVVGLLFFIMSHLVEIKLLLMEGR